MCYMADGANSQQQEILGQLLYRRDEETGRLDSRVISISSISDKTAEGQRVAYKNAMAALAETGEAVGLLDQLAERLGGGAADAAAAGLRVNPNFTPVSSMNDRAPNGRAAARLVRGVGMGDEMPTCAEHAAVNIGEAGMKAVAAALRLAMNITDKSAALDKEKIKGLATAIGWNSSPCNALSYAVAKYVALFSSKGYAIGENFAQWLEAQMRRDEQLEGDLREFVSDLQAI